MATSETANAAMVCQTVASDLMSSVGESPAQSSESALDMVPKRSTQRGIGQGQNVDGHALPNIPGSDGGSDGLGCGRLPLSHSSRESPIGTRSRSPTPRPSQSGRQESGRSSLPGTPSQITAVSKFSGISTPKGGTGQDTPSKDLLGAEEKLSQLLNERASACASPGAMSQVSQKELPDGLPIEFPMDPKGSHFHTPVEFPIQYGQGLLSLPTWNSATASYVPKAGSVLPNSGIFPEPWQSRKSVGGVVEAISATPPMAKAVGEAISPIADAEMIDLGRGTKSPRQTTNADSPTGASPQQEQIFSDWANRQSKRRLHDAPSSSSAMLGATLSPTFSPPGFLPSSSSAPLGAAQQISSEQQMSDAKYYVSRMSQ